MWADTENKIVKAIPEIREMCEFTNGKALLVLSVITFTFSISSRFASNTRSRKMLFLL